LAQGSMLWNEAKPERAETKFVSIGAIVVVGAASKAPAERTARPAILREVGQDALLTEPLPCVEIAGRSLMERTVDRLLSAGVEAISILVEGEISRNVPMLRSFCNKVRVQAADDVGSAIAETLSDYSRNGIEHSFISWARTYVETDLLDLFYFHREGRQPITRAFNCEGPLALWVVDCTNAQLLPLESSLEKAECGGACYFVREYVKRLKSAGDLREFAEDVLCRRCEARPSGKEIRPGIWIDDGAGVHRKSRLVAPVYIGRGVEVAEDALITRFSSIEGDCFVDCGTVIEKSSILANTHVGIWLDVCNAVVSGNKMLSLDHEVMIEISDPSIMRAINHVRENNFSHEGDEKQKKAAVEDMREENPIAAIWQFGANFIQE
jgi:carbonic anhydrase/acetyltransferase-like protein (isoleucine patch superfamily)